MLTNALGRPLRFRINAGQAHDINAAPALLKGQQVDAVLIGKAYDSNDLRYQIAEMEAQAVIPPKRNRKLFITHDTELYKQRNRIERCFGRLKRLRRFVTRCDRRTIHLAGFVHLTATMIRLR